MIPAAFSSALHVVESALGRHLFVVDASRIYDIEGNGELDELALSDLLKDVGADVGANISAVPPPPPLRTLSLQIAQACNMGCGYCYADGGSFQGKARLMTAEVARQAVDRLLVESNPHGDLVLGFMGGEPFLNRPVLHETVEYAAARAKQASRRIRFSVTTNGTLTDERDVELMARHPFYVTISLDGARAAHDRHRRLLSGGGTYDRVVRTLGLFETYGRPQHLSARATVVPPVADLAAMLEHLIGLGFDSVGMAPVLSAPTPSFEMAGAHFQALLREMVACGELAKRAILEGRRHPFANFETALQEIHRGTHRPYPCGAGAAYLSVGADGDLFGCHRLIDDEQFRFGDVSTGSNTTARARHLELAHVDQSDSCRKCWARYLCGGGCYHEVKARGRVGCDYIRGWLSYCLAAYVEILARAPSYFHSPQQHFSSTHLEMA